MKVKVGPEAPLTSKHRLSDDSPPDFKDTSNITFHVASLSPFIHRSQLIRNVAAEHWTRGFASGLHAKPSQASATGHRQHRTPTEKEKVTDHSRDLRRAHSYQW